MTQTIKKYFPEIVEKTLTLENIITKIETIQNEREKRLKTLDNIINRVTVGVQGKDIYDINEKIINLKKPLLTESSKEELDYLFETTIDPEGREVKNVINMK